MAPISPGKKVWKNKLDINTINQLIFDSVKIIDDTNFKKEKKIKPFWNNDKQNISNNIFLHNSSFENKNIFNGNSWFDIQKQNYKNIEAQNNLLFNPNDFILPEKLDTTQDKNLKTLKIRLFPTDIEKEKIHLITDQFRWYNNIINNIVCSHYRDDTNPNKLELINYSYYTVRNLLRKYKYTEENTDDGFKIIDLVYDKNRNENPIPPWWDKIEHSRIARGAVRKFVSSLNSAVSNFKNGNITHFKMKYMSKKKTTDYVHFEDKQFPNFIREIRSTYWITNKEGKKQYISFKDIPQNKGLEIIYEKDTDRYFLHYPVEREWFPDVDRRNDKQVSYKYKGKRIISLDPGVRKFMVGYDPKGSNVLIGNKASIELTNLLYTIDTETNKYKRIILWREIKNLISELHWKTINFLMREYDIILLPDFRISEMVKGRKLARITKRLLYMFSYHSFKEKIIYKCDMYKKQLIIVDESYTSCTCTNCGNINNTKGKEEIECVNCNYKTDRDKSGSRNIFIKNIRLR